MSDLEIPKLKLAKDFRHIAVEGVIGAGKTTLTKLLQESLGGRLVLEEVEDNPFLEKFYQNREGYAFQAQLHFLMSRYFQLRDNAEQQDLLAPLLISDYTFEKDRIFAALNLNSDELNMYDKIVGALDSSHIPEPDFIIYLQTPVNKLLNQIRMRNRSMERKIDPEYLEALVELYNRHFYNKKNCPVLIINTEKIDFVKHNEDLIEVLKRIAECPKGLSYFSPISAG